MSLLLDALKKTGAAQQANANGHAGAERASEMSLEELPGKPYAAAPAATATPAASPAAGTPRSSGENLFAAKRAPARKKFNYNLGIIPTALIIGSVLGVAGGIYVWIEIQPPKAVPYHAPPPDMHANNVTPAPRAAPPLALPAEVISETVVAPKAMPRPPAPYTEHRARPAKVQRAVAAQDDGGIQIQHQQESDTIFSTLTSAYEAYQSGDFNTASQRYREVLRKDGKNRDALLGLAVIAQQQGQDEAAIQHYKQVLQLDPRDPTALAGMASLTIADATVKESRLKMSINQSPQSAALHFALGNLYSDQSRWSDAQQAYFNAASLEPGNAQFAFNLATSLDHMGRKQQAVQYYQQALRLDTTGNAGFDRVQTEQRMKQLQGNLGLTQ
jgi:Flp pilus assembly protein TadD